MGLKRFFNFERQPKSPNNPGWAEAVNAEFRRRAAANEALSLEENSFDVQVTDGFPHIDIHLSDLHYGHDSVAYEQIDKIREYALAHENVAVILYGDVVEGMKPEHLDTHMIHLVGDTTQQLFGFREYFIRPLAEQGKLPAMVSSFKSHEEWLRQNSGLNPYAILSDLGPDLRVAVIYNGGYLHFIYPNGEMEKIAMFHTPGGSNRTVDPTKALRSAAMDGIEPGTDMAVAGHTHHFGGISVVKDTDGHLSIYMQLGAFKGNKGNTDPHARRDMGGRASAPGGAYTVHYQIDGKPNIYATQDQFAANELLESMTLVALAEQNGDGTMDELMERIHSEVEAGPRIQMVKSKSVKRVEAAASSINYRTVYDTVRTDLPLTIETPAGYRQGSLTSDKTALKELVTFAAGTPGVVLSVGRQMLDQDVPDKLGTREKEFDKLMAVLAPLYDNPEGRADEGNIKILCWLMDSIFRKESWKKGEEPFYPGSEVTAQAGIPMLDNQGKLILNMPKGKLVYTGMLVDGTANAGSYENPVQGLATLVQRDPDHIDFAVGGDMPGGGFLEMWNHKLQLLQWLMAPGWLASEHTKGGKRNRSVPVEGQMGITLHPDYRHAYMSANLDQTKAIHQALTLGIGLKKLGGTNAEWVAKLQKRKGTR